MMKNFKRLLLCATVVMSLLAVTACGNNGNDNGTQAPYEDDATENGVNGNGGANGTTNNGATNNGTTNNGTSNMGTTPNDTTGNTENGTVGGDLEDAGRNLMDSVEDTGNAIRDGIDNLNNVDGANNTNR